MNYRDYQNARDAAWRILLDCGVDRLPVDLNIVCRKLGVRLRSYMSADAIAQKIGALGTTDGVLLFYRGDPLILYDSELTPGRVRFTAAHEIGHLVLGHVAPGQRTMVNREPSPGDNPMETSANQFAARLLAPACVLWGLDIHTPEEIAELCHISKQAARFRAERMEVLYARNKFLLSPLEQEVYRNFLPYIQGVKELLNPRQ